MKPLKMLFSVLLLAIVFSSCESDDNRLATVRYQIIGLDSSITLIKYNGSESVVSLTNPNNFADGSDSKTISVNFLPFETKLEVAAANTTSVDKQYVLNIYVNNELEAFYNLVVPANGSSSGIATFTIYAN